MWAAILIGAGMALTAAWSGAPALYPGVITRLEKVSRALQAVSGRAFRGSSLMDNGVQEAITIWLPEMQFSLTGIWIVPAANVIDAGTFGAADAGAAVYLAAFAQQGAGFGVHLLHQHAFEAVDHIDQVALTVGIMQQRRVESDAVQVHRLAPRPCDGSGTAHIVMGVVPTALFGGHVGDKQVVILPIPAQVRGPDTAGVGRSEEHTSELQSR